VNRIEIGKVVPIIKDNKRGVVMKTDDIKMLGLPENFSREGGKNGKELLLRDNGFCHENTRRNTKIGMLLRNILATDLPLPAGRFHGSTRIKIRANQCDPWPCIFRAHLCVFVAPCICRRQ